MRPNALTNSGHQLHPRSVRLDRQQMLAGPSVLFAIVASLFLFFFSFFFDDNDRQGTKKQRERERERTFQRAALSAASTSKPNGDNKARKTQGGAAHNVPATGPDRTKRPDGLISFSGGNTNTSARRYTKKSGE
ncbi:hypothetical protein M514_03018 [Trichuris suis]|uniref:Transmembrane protein n=1 Tax=Trichuris suis TaxID=68888 RepID=A0A085MG94_9BILA|nr:hypothetical protein M513_03018 [Trichuris suis]KFD69099.1 hypothetical protein M514_03018 [Trichuris suis]